MNTFRRRRFTPISRLSSSQVASQEGKPARRRLQKRQPFEDRDDLLSSSSSLSSPPNSESSTTNDTFDQDYQKLSVQLQVKSNRFSDRLSLEKVTSNFGSLLNAIELAGERSGLNLKVLHEWGWKCWQEFKSKNEVDKRFYYIRLKRLLDSKGTSFNHLHRSGPFSFESVYDPNRIFRSRIEYVEEDVLDAVNHFSRAVRISRKDRNLYETWRKQLKNQLEVFLTEQGNSDSAVFAIECELESRARIARKNPIFVDGKVTFGWEPAKIAKHFEVWDYRPSLENLTRQLKLMESHLLLTDRTASTRLVTRTILPSSPILQ